MRNIFVVTHAQSYHHVEGKVGGWYDTGLTDLGKQHATAAAERLSQLVQDRPIQIVSSDLKRAAETAHIINERLGCPLSLTPDLREISFGVADGKEQSWLDEHITMAPDTNRLDHMYLEGAETKRAFVSRVYSAMDRLSDAHDTIIATHGYTMTFIVAHWIGLPLEHAGYVNFSATPAGITHLQQDDLFNNRGVRFLNSTDHLQAIQ